MVSQKFALYEANISICCPVHFDLVLVNGTNPLELVKKPGAKRKDK